MARWVLHVDLDQFIAAVEILRRPELEGLPVVVGGRGDPTERGVVSTASYAAREYGVGSGMPLRVAARKCPDAVFLPVDKPAYDAASAQVMATLRELRWGGVPVVGEVLGWDEAFVGIDDQMRARLMGLLTELDLDVILTSHEFWGFYDTVPELVLYDLTRHPSDPGVFAQRLDWGAGGDDMTDITVQSVAGTDHG